jgi:hypothetical protein
MQDKPLFDLDNEYEIMMISEVLTDLGIPFRLDRFEDTYWGILMGKGASSIFPMGYYAKLWGYEADKERIGEILQEIRIAQPLDDREEDIPAK